MEKTLKNNKRKENELLTSSVNNTPYYGDMFSMSSNANDRAADEKDEIIYVHNEENNIPVSGYVNSLLEDCKKQSSANNTLKLVNW